MAEQLRELSPVEPNKENYSSVDGHLCKALNDSGREREMELTKLKSGGRYEERESYSRLVQIGDWVLMANTAGRDFQAGFMSEDPIEQLHQCIANIKASLAQVDCTLADVVRSRVFIPYREHAADIMAVYGEYFRGIDPVVTVTCSPLGGPDYKVEIEVTAYKGAGEMQQNRKAFKL